MSIDIKDERFIFGWTVGLSAETPLRLCLCCTAVNEFWAAMVSVVPGVASGGNAEGVALMGFG